MEAGDTLRLALLDSASRFDQWGVALSVAFSVATISLAVWLVRFFAPAAAGSGIPHLKGVLLGYRSMVWYRVLWVKFVGGVIGVTGGLTLGREGPTVQMGGALGQMLGSRSHSDTLEQRSLIAAGAGAGLSAIFNAPLAGVVFVLEELQGNFTSLVFFAALIASMTADVLSRGLMGQHPVFHVTVTAIPDLTSLPLFLALGILAGVLIIQTTLCFAFGRYPTAAGQQMDLLGRDHRPDRLVDAGDLRRRPTTGGTDSERAGIHRSLDAGPTVRLALPAAMGSYGTGGAAGGIVPLLCSAPCWDWGSANWAANGSRWSRRNR
ncbi:MAG: chloride channel protein [Candidatus Competibacteraceae bacterium]